MSRGLMVIAFRKGWASPNDQQALSVRTGADVELARHAKLAAWPHSGGRQGEFTPS